MIDRSKPILVFLAGGVQGGAVVRAALARGYTVRALRRDPQGLGPSTNPQLQFVRGDLNDRAALMAATSGLDHAVLQVPIGPIDTMLVQAENAFLAFKRAGLKSFILKLASASRPAPCEEPSLVANQGIEDLARSHGLSFSVVRPTLYLDNLLKPSALKDLLTHQVFSPPLLSSQAIAWTSAEDCAHAAILALESGARHPHNLGQDYRIAGPESLTGDDLAVRISRGLGQTIRYQAQSLSDFEHEVDAALGAGVGRRVAAKFRYFEAHPQEADLILARPYGPQVGLEAFHPTPVETWIRRNKAAFCLTPIAPVA